MILLSLLACGRSAAPIRAALGPDPNAETQVRVLTSVDRGVHWTLRPDTVAHGVSSLHACTFESELWVPAVLDVRDIPWTESAFPVPFVDVLRTSDLEHWTADRIPVRGDTTGGVDPACVVGPSGLEMWFAEVVGSGGDPAQGGRESKIWRSHWNDGEFTDAEVAYTGKGVVDPAPVYVGGQLRLFLNQDGRRIVEKVGDTLSPTWDGVTVPMATTLDGAPVLLAQQPRGGGMLPVWRAITGDQSMHTLDIDRQIRSCESPSMATLGDTWVLLCVDASRRGRPQ